MKLALDTREKPATIAVFYKASQYEASPGEDAVMNGKRNQPRRVVSLDGMTLNIGGEEFPVPVRFDT